MKRTRGSRAKLSVWSRPNYRMVGRAATALLVCANALMRVVVSGSGVGICDPAREKACETAFMECKLSLPASDTDGICGCAAIFFGVCLPTAGCAAAEQMISCINALMLLDCPDMGVCGNDCTLDDGDPLIPADSIVLPVNNFGANYLQLSICSQHVSAAKLNHFGQVSMERCSEDEFRVCDLAIAPRALTAVAFPPDVTYLRVQQCVLTDSDSESDDDGDDQEDEAEQGSWECLTDPLPIEYYGTTVYYDGRGGAAGSSVSHWPSSLNVDYSVAALCEQDSHCPGSFCSSQQQPRICAPKLGEHFTESGEHFLDPRWEILSS